MISNPFKSYFDDIANAINTAAGTTGTIKANEFASRIRNLSKTSSLATPTVSINGTVASWTPVPNA